MPDHPGEREGRLSVWMLVAAVAIMALAGGGGMLRYFTAVPATATIAPSVAGEPITSLGEYRSPDGDTLLILMETVDAKGIIVEAKRLKKLGGCARWQVDATQPWHFMFGQDGSVWGFSSDQGPHHWHSGPVTTGLTIIGIGGGWQGMPESFLASLPQEHRDVHAQWLANQKVARQP